MVQLIHTYKSFFTDIEIAVGKTDVLKMKIVLSNDAVPVHTPVHKIKLHLLDSLPTQIDSWLKDGVIVPAVSPWGSPLVYVAKKVGSTRQAKN